jgi:lipoprotein-anchoring transpeptidase ErfK/SrfK
VFRGGEAIGISTISSGEEGRETPYGRFTILEKQRHHKSNRYDDAPMPYMMRLTWGGIALHAGNLPGYPASHGCIRLPAGFASKLFATADVGTEVFVTYASPASPEEAMEIARAGIEYPGHLPDEVSS